jgi:hypothetical protein
LDFPNFSQNKENNMTTKTNMALDTIITKVAKDYDAEFTEETTEFGEGLIVAISLIYEENRHVIQKRINGIIENNLKDKKPAKKSPKRAK